MADYRNDFQMNLYSTLTMKVTITDLKGDTMKEIEIEVDGAGRVIVSQHNKE